jgi:hypothetical protein
VWVVGPKVGMMSSDLITFVGLGAGGVRAGDGGAAYIVCF